MISSPKNEAKKSRKAKEKMASAAPPWAELPREITAAILQKLGQTEMLITAEKVCSAWRSVCEDSSMWRHIDLGDLWEIPYDYEKMCRYAVDRSQGQLIAINIEYLGTNKLLHHISQSCGELRCLRLLSCCKISSTCLIEAVKKFPLLEELCLYSYRNIEAVGVIEAIGKSCPQLKSFALTRPWIKYSDVPFDLEAQAIAKNMPQLRHLRLFGSQMTNDSLHAILDACPHLESLDLRECFNICFGENLGLLCTQRIKDLWRPHRFTFTDE